jgi:HK97 family phage portal protein
VYACENRILDRAGDVSWGLFEDLKDDTERIKEHSTLTLLKRPNPRHTYETFLKEWGMYLYNAGESYIWANKLGSGKVKELWHMPAPDVDIVKGANYGEIDSFKWTIDNVAQTVPAEEVLYVRLPHPRDIYKGLSVLSAAGRAVDYDNESLKWNLSAVLNSGKAGGQVTLDSRADVDISDAQWEKLEKRLKEKSGASNIGEYLVFRQPGLKLEQYGWTPADMDWLKGLDKSEVLICNCFGVPPELMGIQGQKTYNNYQEAMRALYVDAVLPTLKLFFNWLSEWEYLGLEANQYFKAIKSDIDVLQPDQLEKRKVIQGDVDRGIITRNEARTEIGKSTSKAPEADVLTVTVGKDVIPLELVSMNLGIDQNDLRD